MAAEQRDACGEDADHKYGMDEETAVLREIQIKVEDGTGVLLSGGCHLSEGSRLSIWRISPLAQKKSRVSRLGETLRLGLCVAALIPSVGGFCRR